VTKYSFGKLVQSCERIEYTSSLNMSSDLGDVDVFKSRLNQFLGHKRRLISLKHCSFAPRTPLAANIQSSEVCGIISLVEGLN